MGSHVTNNEVGRVLSSSAEVDFLFIKYNLSEYIKHGILVIKTWKRMVSR